MAYRAKRPTPKLTFKDFARQVTNNFKKSSILERIVIVLLVFLVGQIFYHLVFVPGDQSLDTAVLNLKSEITGENLQLLKKGREKADLDETGGQQSSVEQQLAKIDEAEAAYKFDPKGRRDPFFPFDFSPSEDSNAAKTPLERYDLGQLKLTAIIAGLEQPKAIVENAAGKGFTVGIGTKMGRNGGIIVAIEKEKIVIREKRIDFTGKEQAKDIELRLRIASTNPDDF
jgi:type IV pilus assembly protein PilP